MDTVTIQAKSTLIDVSIVDVISGAKLAFVALPEVPTNSHLIRLRTRGREHSENWEVTGHEWVIETGDSDGIPARLRWVVVYVKAVRRL